MKPASPDSDRPMPPNRIATQARICAHIITEALGSTLAAHHPADRSLRELFAANHQLGSRDRRIISETLFSVLRWWGWLAKLAPKAFTEALAAGVPAPPAHGSDWFGVFAASWLLENRFELPPSVMFWLREAGLYPELFADIPADTPFLDRRRYLRPFFQKSAMPALRAEDLLPAWLQEALAPEEKVDYMKLLEWEQRRPPVWLRAQTTNYAQLKGEIEHESEKAIKLVPHPTLVGAFSVSHASANFRALAAFRDGRFEIQDLASQCVALVAAPRPGEQWWDACAGAGGKSLHLAWLMNNRGTILATDLREAPLEELRLRARRGKFGNIRTREWKGNAVPPQMKDRFDGVLVDVPCSCSGTWRRAPDGRWNTTLEQIPQFAALQLQLLTNAAAAVKVGGTLVYSTCSMLRAENQAVVEQFLAANPEFALTPHDDPLGGTPSLGMTQIWPWQGNCDAMFTAKMTRRRTQA